MGNCHHMAAMFIDSFTGVPSHRLLETGCSSGLGWSCPVLPGKECWGWEAVAGNRAGRRGVCLLGQTLCLARAMVLAGPAGLGSRTDQVGRPGAPRWLGAEERSLAVALG